MSVHQINEFYIHMEAPEVSIKKVKEFLLKECADFYFDHDGLTVDGFNSESEAVQFENKIKELL